MLLDYLFKIKLRPGQTFFLVRPGFFFYKNSSQAENYWPVQVFNTHQKPWKIVPLLCILFVS